MDLFYLIAAMIAGACAPIQAGINAQLASFIDDPILAAMISFAIGTVGLLAVAVVLRVPVPALHTMTVLPWWLWCGGLLGAFLVFVTIVLVPKLGAATLMAFFVAGQMMASLVLDQYGLFGYPLHPVSLWRVVGIMLLVVGVVLIKRF